MKFNHSVKVMISEDGTFFVSKFSNIHSPPKVGVWKVELDSSKVPQVIPMGTVAVKTPHVSLGFPVNPPEIFNFPSGGETIYGALWRPAPFDPSQKYPTILHIYGGPGAQYVVNDYERLVVRLSKFNMYASLGFAVVVIDGRGSSGRTLNFQRILKHSMGVVEMEDQLAGLSHLIERGIVDPTRIAITGWSYGGYMSLMALAQHPDIFKLSISGAPVTLWEAYDSAYTERYMDTKERNPEGYRKGSVLEYASKFPDEEGRLLILHGLKDENVHFCHTTRLIEALVEAHKPYDLHVYPKERHGIRALGGHYHSELKVLSMLSTL